MKIVNRTSFVQQISVVRSDGVLDSITLQARGRAVDLPSGWSINPDKIAEYHTLIKTDPPLSEFVVNNG